MSMQKIQITGGIFINENYENQQLKYCNDLIREIKIHSGNQPSIFHVGNYSEQVSLMGNFDKNSNIRIVKYLNPKDQEDIINKNMCSTIPIQKVERLKTAKPICWINMEYSFIKTLNL